VTAFLRRRLKHIADVRFSNVDKLAEAGEAPVRLCNYTDVYNNERIDAAMPFMTATATTAEIRRFRLHVGDVILTKDSESPTDIAVPAVVASTAADLVCGYHLAMVRPRRGVLLGRYLQRALQADGIRQQFYLSANGVTRFGLSQDAIGNALVPVPPLRNQEVIADFLDMRTLAIDALIDKQEQLLRLLAEKRQVVITQAVTKGLDLSVPMKDSGVDWVGPCPAGWLRVRVSYVADVCNGSTPDRNNDAYWVNGDIPWLSSGKVNDFIVNEATEAAQGRRADPLPHGGRRRARRGALRVRDLLARPAAHGRAVRGRRPHRQLPPEGDLRKRGADAGGGNSPENLEVQPREIARFGARSSSTTSTRSSRSATGSTARRPRSSASGRPRRCASSSSRASSSTTSGSS
jgi:hypothetical protein